MSFPNINQNTPVGTQRPQVLDDELRQLKSDVIQSFKEISGFPNVNCIVLPTWTTSTRPDATVKEGMIGWNSDTGCFERSTGTGWISINPNANNALTVGGVRVTISDTAPTSPQNKKELWFNLSNNLWYTYNGGWIPSRAVFG